MISVFVEHEFCNPVEKEDGLLADGNGFCNFISKKRVIEIAWLLFVYENITFVHIFFLFGSKQNVVAQSILIRFWNLKSLNGMYLVC